jgi:hypothetical protein
MDTPDELRAEAHREQANRRARWNGEPPAYIEHDAEPEQVTADSVMVAASTYATAFAAAHGTPQDGAFWRRSDRARAELERVIKAYGTACAEGEVTP